MASHRYISLSQASQRYHLKTGYTTIITLKGCEHMPLPKNDFYTIADIYALPDGKRAELIDGQIYDMAPPSPFHQELVMELSATIRDYIKKNKLNIS